MVAGVVVAANCQVALPAFGFLFMLVGAVLTAASYRGPGQDEGPDHYAARVAFTGNSRVLGPACIVVGAVMLAAGVGLCLLTRRARRRERRVGFHCPLHGDFYPLSPVTGSRLGSPTGEETSSITTGTTKIDLPPVGSPKLSSPRTEITVVAPVTVPLPHSPTPPVAASQVQETIKATAVVVSRGPRKSVSIVLPDEENG
ncbi:hypothetical protein C0J52_04796 [Blattella germanica]|nr:hypothetical protein C0J52_04796 [Blattella germanica]